MSSGRVGVALVGILLLGTAFAGPAGALRPQPHPITFHSHFEDPGFLTGFEGVSPAPPAVPTDAVFHGSSTVTGPVLHGTAVYTVWGHPQSDGSFAFHTFETLTGTVVGCGQGKISYTVQGTTSGSPLAMALNATVAFVPGSGTGGLRAVRSGSGTLTGTSSVTTSNSGSFDGTIVCGR